MQSSADLEVGQPLGPGLYIVATPIGNLQDITLRALSVLRRADLVACEDTRVTAKLLSHYDIHVPTLAYHDANAERARPKLLARLRDGAKVALVSDAGTPLISDPGFKLVRAALAAGVSVVPIPGPSSVLAALTVAGLPTDRFFFLGFLPAKSGQRRSAVEAVRQVPATLVVLESPQRLGDCLADLAAILGARPAAVARELTKHFEETVRGELGGLAARFAASPPKGEVVIVVGPPSGEALVADAAATDALLREALATHRPAEAAALVAQRTGRARRDVYARALALRKQ
jgi:16S rRNA (cytidine1402-2'-O)-methyltransferase